MMSIIIPAAGFLGVAALVGAVAMMFRGPEDSVIESRLDALTGHNKQASGGDSSVLASPLDDMPNLIEEFFSRFLDLRRFLQQADIGLIPTNFLLISAGLFVVGCAGMWFTPLHWGLAIPVGLVTAALPFGFAAFQRGRRKSKFSAQLPEALELVARALRAGHSLGSGFQLVSTEMADPIGREFSRVFEEQNLGVPLEKALESMCDRVPNVDLRFFATAVILQRQTGGDLAEILDKIGSLIRERFKLHGMIQALTGEGRLSGIVLLALPPGLFVVLLRLNPDYVMMLFEDPFGQKMLAGAIVMQLLGALVIKKIINIRV